MPHRLSDSHSIWSQLREQLDSLGYDLPTEPPTTGSWHRIAAAGKAPSNRSAAVKLTPDGMAIHLVDYANGLSKTVQVHTGGNHKGFNRGRVHDVARQQAQHIDDVQNRQRAGTESARNAWSRALPLEQHNYLDQKAVSLEGCRVLGGEILVPLTDINGALMSLQRIDAKGRKRCWPGAPVRGAAYRMGNALTTRTIVIAEGAATGATLHAETGYAVVAAMFAGNLEPVARALHGHYPRADIVIAGDDDRRKSRNVGREKATTAARAIGARLAFPQFCPHCVRGCTDFNDLATCEQRGGGA